MHFPTPIFCLCIFPSECFPLLHCYFHHRQFFVICVTSSFNSQCLHGNFQWFSLTRSCHRDCRRFLSMLFPVLGYSLCQSRDKHSIMTVAQLLPGRPGRLAPYSLASSIPCQALWHKEAVQASNLDGINPGASLGDDSSLRHSGSRELSP